MLRATMQKQFLERVLDADFLLTCPYSILKIPFDTKIEMHLFNLTSPMLDRSKIINKQKIENTY